MRVLLTGATGFLGRPLVAALRARGHDVVVVSRDAAHARARLGAEVTVVEAETAYAGGEWQDRIAGSTAVINLAGAGLGDRRWNAQWKQICRDSRIETTRYLVEGIAALSPADRPAVLVSASGTDYYPFAEDLAETSVRLTEDDDVTEKARPGDSFLARLCREWEAEARAAEASGVRVVLMRTGLVLGRGAALARMTAPFRFLVGGRLGPGQQWVSWIHIADAVAGYLFALDRTTLHGPVNLVAPDPVRQRDLARAIGKAMHRPALLPTPAFAVKAAAGELAEYILHGRRAVPAALQAAGFTWQFPALDAALADLLQSK
ncbi:MAG TPA: TIGR01777 family oxidoreductase [Kofleriaceae bacterium]|nr:TIGR01777 family oxidoreductase [Kofleriaceae bacterium]